MFVLVWPVSLWLHTSWHALHLHGDSSYPESAIAYNSELAAQDGHLYRSWHNPPFTPAPYGPIYYSTLALLAKYLSLDHLRLLMAGRIGSFLAFLGTLFMLFRLARRFGLPVFFAALHDISPWNATVRPDFPALFFTLVGFLICSKESATVQDAMVGGICFAVSLMMKQSFLVAPAVVFLMWLIHKEFKLLSAYSVSIAAVVGLSLAVPWLNNDSIFSNILTTGQGLIDFHIAFSSLFESEVSTGIHFPLLVCTMVGVMVGIKKSTGWPLLVYLFVVWFLGIFTWIRILGSNINVFLEAWAVSVVFAALGMQYLFKKFRFLAPSVLVLALLLFSVSPGSGLNAIYVQKMKEMPELSCIESIVPHYRLLSDDSYLEAISASPMVLDAFANNQLEVNGVWDSSPVTQMVHAHQYDMVIFTVEGRWIRRYRETPFMGLPVLRAINTEYDLVCHLPKFPGFSTLAVWLPKGGHRDRELFGKLQSIGCR